MSAQPDLAPCAGQAPSIATWRVTLLVRGASRRLSPRFLDELAFLQPTVDPAPQPNRRVIAVTVKATSAAMALDYSRRRTAQALTDTDPWWRIASPGTARQVSDADAALDLLATAERPAGADLTVPIDG